MRYILAMKCHSMTRGNELLRHVEMYGEPQMPTYQLKEATPKGQTPYDPNHLEDSRQDKTMEMARSVGCQGSGYRGGRTQVFLTSTLPAGSCRTPRSLQVLEQPGVFWEEWSGKQRFKLDSEQVVFFFLTILKVCRSIGLA